MSRQKAYYISFFHLSISGLWIYQPGASA